jgi:phosphatidylglycerol---prolipoprotein diacylglyceryl transferase
MVGARLFWALAHWDQLVGDPWGTLSAGGSTFYGGLFGALITVSLVLRLYRVPLGAAANCCAVAIPVGYMIGRIGCFLAGDDYGRPTGAAWGIAFPQGSPPTTVPVHPTQIYEILLMLPIFLVLWSQRKRGLPGWFLLWEYFVLAGLERFVIEFYRVNPVVALGLTTAQWISIGLVAWGVGGMGWAYAVRPSRRSANSPSAV